MNKEQFKHFRREQGVPTIPGLMELTDRTPRTLLYGYTCSRATHHVYIGQDGFIHVLLYAPLHDVDGPGMGGLDFLVLQHAYGETGGQGNVHGYVPDKRVYPEFSDFEFCKLLDDCGVDISFTGFRENVQMRQTYQGETLEHGRSEKGVELLNQVRNHRRFPKYADDVDKLAYRLVGQAARDTGTPFAALGMDSQIYVAESGVDKVLRHVEEYLFEMYEEGLYDYAAEDLVFNAFGKTRSMTVESKHQHFGGLTYDVSSLGPVALAEAGLTCYSARAEGHPEKAFAGTYRDRPFVIYTMGERRYRLELSQFGDPVKFMARNLKHYEAAATM